MVSVCLTTYNGEKYIEQQISSIIKQLNLGDEIIVSDDGSTDQTLNIIESFGDKRIKIFHHNNSEFIDSKYRFNLTTRNMENALLKAQGDYIFMADQDDIWLDNRIDTIIPLLAKYSVVVNDCKIINENEIVINDSYFDLINAKKGIVRNLFKNSYLGCCMAFRKDLLNHAIPFPNLAVPHDIWIGLIAEIFGEVHFTKKKLILYRRHGNNLSNSAQSSNNSIAFRFKYRLFLVRALMLRSLKK